MLRPCQARGRFFVQKTAEMQKYHNIVSCMQARNMVNLCLAFQLYHYAKDTLL